MPTKPVLDPKTKSAVQKLIDANMLTEDDVQTLIADAVTQAVADTKADLTDKISSLRDEFLATAKTLRDDAADTAQSVAGHTTDLIDAAKRLRVLESKKPTVVVAAAPESGDALDALADSGAPIVPGPTTQYTALDGKGTVVTSFVHATTGRPAIVTHALHDVEELAQRFGLRLGPQISVDAEKGHVAYEVVSGAAKVSPIAGYFVKA